MLKFITGLATFVSRVVTRILAVLISIITVLVGMWVLLLSIALAYSQEDLARIDPAVEARNFSTVIVEGASDNAYLRLLPGLGTPAAYLELRKRLPACCRTEIARSTWLPQNRLTLNDRADEILLRLIEGAWHYYVLDLREERFLITRFCHEDGRCIDE